MAEKNGFFTRIGAHFSGSSDNQADLRAPDEHSLPENFGVGTSPYFFAASEDQAGSNHFSDNLKQE